MILIERVEYEAFVDEMLECILKIGWIVEFTLYIGRWNTRFAGLLVQNLKMRHNLQ